MGHFLLSEETLTMTYALARSAAEEILAEMSYDDRLEFDPKTWREDIAYQLADLGVEEDLDLVIEEIVNLIEADQ